MKLFISHASEDKSKVAKPLADLLISRGVSVWYDEYSLKLGDALKRSIDRGLADCDFGLVILSKNFFDKQWPMDELSALTAIEVAKKKKVILPIWHELSFDEVLAHSPTLADRLSVPTSAGLDKIADMIFEAIKPATEKSDQREPSAPDSSINYTCRLCGERNSRVIQTMTSPADGTFTRQTNMLMCNKCFNVSLLVS